MKNIELFNKVADHVLGNEAALFMPNWIGAQPYRSESKEQAVCNTTACVAGWACILSGEAPLTSGHEINGKKYAYWKSPEDGWEKAGYRLLGGEGMDNGDLLTLFYSDQEEALAILNAVRNDGLTLREAIFEVLG